MLVSKEVGPDFFYSPDPSSYSVCSIGGNVSHDSGGIHVPKYGSTFSHVLGIEVITVEGKIVKLGALKRRSYRGLDPRSVFIGSEGTIGVIAKVYLRIIRKPEVRRTLMAVFNTVEEASKGVVEVFRAGIIPSALEMIDDITIDIIERSRYKSNYPIGKIYC
jgi:FAD/FMN-containing dehydrogenases